MNHRGKPCILRKDLNFWLIAVEHQSVVSHRGRIPVKLYIDCESGRPIIVKHYGPVELIKICLCMLKAPISVYRDCGFRHNVLCARHRHHFVVVRLNQEEEITLDLRDCGGVSLGKPIVVLLIVPSRFVTILIEVVPNHEVVEAG